MYLNLNLAKKAGYKVLRKGTSFYVVFSSERILRLCCAVRLGIVTSVEEEVVRKVFSKNPHLTEIQIKYYDSISSLPDQASISFQIT